jgi:uncharacterized protein YjbI with pentapeptide repeats
MGGFQRRYGMTDDEIIKRSMEEFQKNKCNGDFGDQQFYAWSKLSMREKARYERDEFTAEDRANMHTYLVSRMTPEQQTLVDSLLYNRARYMIDVDLPKSQFNHSKDLLKSITDHDLYGGSDVIGEEKNRFQRSGLSHPLFDHRANYKDQLSWNNDFQLNLFDPYQEYEYISDIETIRHQILRTCEEQTNLLDHEVKRFIDLDTNVFVRLNADVQGFRRNSQGKLSHKYFFNFAFSLLFGTDSAQACLYPDKIRESVFFQCSFDEQVLFGMHFENCVFIDSVFDESKFDGTMFTDCEFYSTRAKETRIEETSMVIFDHCYFHNRIENEVGSPYIGDRCNQPWNKTFFEDFYPRSGRNSIQSRVMFKSCVGVPTNADFLNTLDRDSKGFICYKRIGKTSYPRPLHWKIKKGSFLTENINTDVLEECERGVNVANFFFALTNYENSPLWKCRIRYEDAGDICVPLGSSGKFRATRVELLHVIPNRFELKKICEYEVAKYNKMRIIPRIDTDISEHYECLCQQLKQEYAQKMYQKADRLTWWYSDYNDKIALEGRTQR